ncbi:nuclease [Rhynchospora pubera]|uniref:Nuclease n=1 Tax=Rhynchospora pubera TaxID=906938 RepID=A0AAV8FKH0_9POAL|nr:nuclease [Rhynchospora pubera]
MPRNLDERKKRKRQRNYQAALWWYNAAVQFAIRWRDLRREGNETGAERITRHLNSHPSVCHNHYRLNPSNFRILCDELKLRGLECQGDVILEECVGMFLQMVAQGTTMRGLAEDFQHSEETVWRYIHLVRAGLLRMKRDYIKLPGPDAQVHPKLREGTQYYAFKDAIGAIDGTHIPAFPDTDEEFKERWRNRKGNITQNVMAAVDFDGRFVAVLAGWEGSGHDSLILRKAVEKGFTIPEGRYYLVDGGYPNTHQFLSPYRGITYHLAQFRQRRMENRYENGQELFNHRHAQLRNVVEKTFGILKGRFRLLKDMHQYKYDFQTDIVLACCVIHNFLIRHPNSHGDNLPEEAYSDESDGSDTDDPSTSGVGSMAAGSRRTDAQRGSEMRDKIRDLLWNSRCGNAES